jgi:predicted RNA-binding protein with RPS1 domain
MSGNKNFYSILSNETNEINEPIKTNEHNKSIINKIDNSKNVEESLKPGIIFGTIKNIVGYGIFVDVGIGFNGLLHISQIGKVLKKHIWNPSDIYEINQQIPVKILNIDKSNQKILLELVDLKIKKNDIDEWKNILNLPLHLIKNISEKVNKNKRYLIHVLNVNYNKLLNINKIHENFFKNNKCAITKNDFKNEVIGIKINIERYPNSNEISYITPLINYISLNGYNSGNFSENEDGWIPICIDENDLYLVENKLAKIFGIDKFYVWMVMQIFPYMLNTMVVQEITEQSPNNDYFIRYFHIAHILVLFAKKYPEIRRLSDKKISGFISNDWNRSKKSTPSIGALISTLLVSENYCWPDLAYPSLNESFSRNVKWVLNHHPELVENIILDSNRVEKTFKSTIGSLRLLMLHVGYQKIIKNSSSYWKCYDLLQSLNGIPTDDIINEVSDFRKNVYDTKNWNGFFEQINLSTPKDSYLADWLRKSVIHSKKRRYHISSKNFTVQSSDISDFDSEEKSIYDGIL